MKPHTTTPPAGGVDQVCSELEAARDHIDRAARRTDRHDRRDDLEAAAWHLNRARRHAARIPPSDGTAGAIDDALRLVARLLADVQAVNRRLDDEHVRS